MFFLDRNVSDNEMDKKNEEYIKSGCGIGENAKKSTFLLYLICRFRFFITFAHETS